VKETHHFHYCASTIISSTLNLKQLHTLQSSITTHSDKQNTTCSMNNISTTKCLPLANMPDKKKKKKTPAPKLSTTQHQISGVGKTFSTSSWGKDAALRIVLHLLAADFTLHSIERHTC
jgi:hypothetical protein